MFNWLYCTAQKHIFICQPHVLSSAFPSLFLKKIWSIITAILRHGHAGHVPRAPTFLGVPSPDHVKMHLICMLVFNCCNDRAAHSISFAKLQTPMYCEETKQRKYSNIVRAVSGINASRFQILRWATFSKN